MDFNKLKTGSGKLLKKYRFAVLIFVIGLILMIMPSFQGDIKTVHNEPQVQIAAESVEQRVESILSYIDGAGKVKVLLMELKGQQTVYQTDHTENTGTESSSYNQKTVTVSGSDRAEEGLVKQINPPQYAGAIILCQGADDQAVKLAVADAVSKITGLGLDKIAVLKMK